MRPIGRSTRALLVASLAFLAGCGDGGSPGPRPAPGEAETPPVAVRLEAVRLERVPVVVEATGTVRARASAVVASQIQATVREVRVREGARVAAGELLVRLDDAEVAADARRAEAARQAAEHARDEARRGEAEARAREREAQAAVVEARAALETLARAVEEAAAAVTGAESLAAHAEATLARHRQMFEERALAPQEYEEVQARARAAAAELARARARLLGARAAVTQQEGRIAQAVAAGESARVRVEAAAARVQGAAARVGEADAEITRTRAVLAHARVLAPRPGLVVDTLVEVGDLATPGRPLVRLDDPAGYRLEAAIPAGGAAALGIGQSVEVLLREVAAAPLAGRVAEIVPEADPATRTVTVKIDLPAAPGLRGGLHGQARLVTGQVERLHVPATAVVERGQIVAVFVVDRDRVARLRLVTVGARAGDRVEVLSGLAAGEEVAVEGAPRLVDGTRVTIGS